MNNNKIGFNNFKAFGPKIQYFTKKPITLIYGPNSVGKSSLVHALGYRNQTLRANKYNLGKVEIGDSIEFTNFTNFIHKKNPKNQITFEYSIPEYNAGLHLQIGRKDSYIVKDLSANYTINNEIFLNVEYITEDEYLVCLHLNHPLMKIKYTNLDDKKALPKKLQMFIRVGDNQLFCNMTKFEINSSELSNIENTLFKYAFENIAEITTKIHKSKKFSYVEPLRYYPNAADIFNEDSENTRESSKQFWLNLAMNIELIDFLNNWLSNKILYLPYEIKTENIIDTKKIPDFHNLTDLSDDYMKSHFPDAVATFVTFIDKRTNIQVHNREIGLGLTQLLPIISKAFEEKESIIAIEQPELHLHPALQCEIADIFIQSYKDNDNEFLIETHSEHLLLRIMKRMRQTAEGILDKNDPLALTPDDVCLLYVDNDGESTYLQELRLSDKGTLLDHWPHGFFEEGYKERFS